MTRHLPPFEPEFALAAACALLDEADLRQAAPALLARPQFDWARLAEVAFFNEVEQVVRARLETMLPGAMPGDVAAQVQQASVRTSALQSVQQAAAVRICQALAAAGVPSIVIKGAALAQMLYAPTPELRASNDVDIVIPPEHLDEADRVLRHAGLVRSWPEASPPEAARPMFLRLANVFDYRGPILNELVELHCRPTLNPYWLPLTFADLQRASTAISLGRGQVQALDGPLNVYYLSQHALYSLAGFRLKWFGDIARALRREGADNCAHCIGRHGAALPVRTGLLADEILALLKQGIAQAAAGDARSLSGSSDAVLIVGHMASAAGISTERTFARLPLELWYHSLALRHLPSLRGKARQVLLTLAHPSDATTLRLGPKFTFVYWLAGPWLALARFISRGRKVSRHEA